MKDVSFGGSLSQDWKKIVNFLGGTKISSRKICCANSAETEEKTLMIQTIKTFGAQGIYHRNFLRAMFINPWALSQGGRRQQA